MLQCYCMKLQIYFKTQAPSNLGNFPSSQFYSMYYLHTNDVNCWHCHDRAKPQASFPGSSPCVRRRNILHRTHRGDPGNEATKPHSRDKAESVQVSVIWKQNCCQGIMKQQLFTSSLVSFLRQPAAEYTIIS